MLDPDSIPSIAIVLYHATMAVGAIIIAHVILGAIAFVVIEAAPDRVRRWKKMWKSWGVRRGPRGAVEDPQQRRMLET